MDILKKFRYNFHYWLRNCYQADDNAQSNSQQDIYHMAEDALQRTDQMMQPNTTQNKFPAQAIQSSSTSAMRMNKQSSGKVKLGEKPYR